MLNLFSYTYFFYNTEQFILRPKNYPEIGRVKIFLSLTHSQNRMCIRIHIFNFKKRTNRQKHTGIQKSKKKLRKKKRISLENQLKKINWRRHGWRFFSSPVFPEKIVFLPNVLIVMTKVGNTAGLEGRNKKCA